MSDSALTQRKMFRGDTVVLAFQVVRNVTTGALATVAQLGVAVPNFPSNSVPQNLTGFTLWMTLKRSPVDPDNQALSQIDNAIVGGITITNFFSGQATARIESGVSITFPDEPTSLYYDIQAKDPNGVITTVESGMYEFDADITRTTNALIPPAPIVAPTTFAAQSSQLVATISALIALHGYDGCRTFVLSVRSPWQYIANGSQFAIDHITVEATADGGNSRWVRDNDPSPVWLMMSDWYIDWIAGNDENDGSVSAPIKSCSELTRRLGSSPRLSQNTIVHIASSQPVGAEVVALAPILLGPNNFGIIGVPNLVSTFTAGVVTAKNRATNAQFKVAGFPGGAAAKMLVVNNTRGGSRSIVQSIIAGVATLSQPLVHAVMGSVDVFGPWNTIAEVDTWTAGDSLSVYLLPTLNLWSFRVSGGGPGNVGTRYPSAWLQNLVIPDPIYPSDTSLFAPAFDGGYLVIADCDIEPFIKIGQGNSFTRVLNTYAHGGIAGDNVLWLGGIIDDYGITVQGEGCQLDADVMFTAASFNQLNGHTTAIGLVNMLGFIEVNGEAFAFSSYDGNAPRIWGVGLAIDVAPDACFEKPPGTWVNLFPGGATLTLGGASTGTYYTPGSPGSFTSGVSLTPANLDVHGALFDPARGARFCDF